MLNKFFSLLYLNSTSRELELDLVVSEPSNLYLMEYLME